MKKWPAALWVVGTLMFTACTGSIAATLVPAGSVWKYLDDGSNPGATWHFPIFDDASWSSGPGQLGYGDGDEATVVGFGPNAANKYITTYFRRSFQATGTSAIQQLTLRVLRDDGVVVYLNGTEVFRNNLPPGPISSTTLAVLAVGGAEEYTLYLTATIPTGALVEGANVLAAEVHQVTANSSDLSFDAELLTDAEPPPPGLPVVSLSAPDGEAGEQSGGANSGSLRVTRSGSTTNSLIVTVAYEGSAANGSDYVQLPIKIEIPAGSSFVTITIDPLDDTEAEGTELLVARLVTAPCENQPFPGADCYQVGSPAQAAVQILDNDAEPPPPESGTLIPQNSVWRYLDNGSDQQTAWREPAFDDSAWAAGPGQLGYGDGDEATVVSFGPDPSNKYVTTYFRHAFELTNAAPGSLKLLVLRDDGVAVYLNGVEVFRNNLPSGEITFNTPASTIAADENVYVEAFISGAALVPGRNVVAAEVHQVNFPSSDLGFDLALLAADGPPPPNLPVVILEATDATAAEGGEDSGAFRISRTGPTTNSLTVKLAYSGTAANGADYLELPMNVEIPAGTSSVSLTVEPLDDNETEGTESVLARILTPECANETIPDPGCYRVGPLSEAELQIMDNEPEPPPPVFGTLIASNSVWKYLDDGSDQGTAWRAPEFDDTLWSSGPGQLGYGDGDEVTVVNSGPNSMAKYTTTYFRRAFDVPTSALDSRLVLRVLRDDGVAVYLNGVEVFRDNLPLGDVAFNTLASSVAGDENAYVQAAIPATALVSGRNVIAAEIHQVNPTSSDISFDLALLTTDGPTPPELPLVTIEASATHAAESGTSTGLLLVKRTGPTAESLSVTLAYGGSAANATDYAQLPITFEIPAGTISASLTVEALDDERVEGNEFLVASVVQPPCANQVPPGPGCYRVGSPAQATVQILDNDIDPPSPPVSGTLIAANSVWKYWDDGSDQGTAWREAEFDDSAWPSGPGQLGYGDGDESTVISFGPNSANKYITTYFRRTFEVTNASFATNLTLRVLRDDGAAIFLNGVELVRQNLPDGALTFTTLAVSVDVEENSYVEAVVPASALREGSNVIAAEVHQVNPASSDVGFDLALFAAFRPRDGDSDGVPDDRDQCLDTPAGAAVDEHGCSLSQAVPCPSSGGSYPDYLSEAISRIWRLYRSGTISANERRTMTYEAVMSPCGRDGTSGEPLRLHLLPLTAEECRRDGLRFVVSGDSTSDLIIESSSDLTNWTPWQTLDAADLGNEVACPYSELELRRFLRVRSTR